MKKEKSSSFKTLLLGEQSAFFSFMGKELQEIAVGVFAMAYLPIVIVFQIYIGFDIYDAYVAEVSYMRSAVMFLMVIILEFVYILYILKLRKKRAEIIKIVKAAEALPQIIIQTWLAEISNERVKFKDNERI